MIVVNAKAKTNSETILALKDVINTLEVETKKEKGCIDYAFSVDISNPSIVRISELWEDRGSLEAHLTTVHVDNFRNAMAQNPMDVEAHFYKVTEFNIQDSDNE